MGGGDESLSATIDERVVEMKFDNTNFEANVKTTMSTLDKLKQALKFDNATESLKTISMATKDMTFENMQKAIDTVNYRFSTLGIIGATVIEDLTKKAINFTTNVLTAIPNQIKNGGWARATNVEQAKFQLEGLGIAWKDVADDIDHAVLGTAYGSDAAAKAASQLAASGVKYGGIIGQITDKTGELKDEWSDMGKSLRAISGVAAMTNSSYEEIAHIFTTVAGQGKLMTMQLNQLAGRGLNVAGKLAEVLGTSEANVREMVTKGKIDFQTFANAMDEAFGEHATAADKTLSGSLSNMKASLSRIGQDFAQTIMQQSPRVFTSIKEFFNKIRTYTRPFADYIFTPVFRQSAITISTVIKRITDKMPAFSNGGKVAAKYIPYISAIKYALFGVGQAITNLLAFFLPVRDAFRETIGNPMTVERIWEIARAFHEWGKNAIITDATAEAIKNVLKLIINLARIAAKLVGHIVVALSPLTKILVAILGFVVKVAGAIADLILKFTGLDGSGKSLQILFENITVAINVAADVIVYLIGLLGDLAESFIITKGMMFLDFIVRVGVAIKDFCTSIHLGQKLLIGLITVIAVPIGLVAALVAGIAMLVAKIYELGIVQNIIAGITTAFNIARDAIVSFVTTVKEGAIAMGEFIASFKISDVIDSIKKSISDAATSFKNFLKSIGVTTETLNDIKLAFDSLLDKINIFKDDVTTSQIVNEISTSTKNAIPTFKNFSEVLAFVGEKIKFVWDQLDFGKIAVIAYTITMISLMNSIKKMVTGFTQVTTSIAGVGKSISGFINSWKKKQQSQLMQTAEAILMLAAALAILTSCDQDALKSTTIILAQFMVVVAAFAGIMYLIAKGLGSFGAEGAPTKIIAFQSVIAAFIALSGSFMILAMSLRILNGLEFSENLMKNIGLIIGTVTALMLLTALFTKLSGKSGLGLKGAMFMLSFSVVLLALGKAFSMLSTIDFTVIKANVKEIVIVMGMMGVLAFAASKIGVFNALGLLALVMVLKNVTPELVSIFGTQMVKVFDGMLKSIKKYIDVVEILAVLVAAITVISGIFGKGMNKFGSGVLKISASFVVLAYGIKMLASLSAGDVAKGVSVVAKVLVLYGMLALIMSIGSGGENAHKIAAAIGGMVLSLYAIAGAIYILGKMNPVAVMRGLKAVQGIMLCFAAVVGAASIGNGKASFMSVLALVTGLVLILGEMVVLTMIDVEKVRATAFSIASVMIGLSFIIRSIPKGNLNAVSKGTIPMLLVLIAMIGAIGAALYAAGNKGFAAAFGAAISLKMVMSAAFELFKSMNSYVNNGDIKFNKIYSVITVMFATLVAIAVPFTAAVAVASKFGASALQIVAMAAGMWLIVKAMIPLIRELSELKGFTKPKAKNVVTTFLSILPIAAAMALLSAAVGYFKVSPLQIITMALSMVLLVGAVKKLILSIEMVPKFTKAKASALVIAALSLIPVAAALGGLAIAINKTGTGLGTLIVSTIVLMMVMASFRKLIITISSMPMFNVSKALSLVLASSSIAIIGYTLYQVAKQPWESILASAVSIIGVMLALGAIISIISTLTSVATVPNILIGLVTMAGTLMLVGSALVALAEIDKDGRILAEAEMLSKILFAIAAVTAVLGILGVAAGAGAVAALSGISALVYGLMTVLDDVARYFQEMEATQYASILSGIEKLNVIGAQIAEGIGEFIGNLGEAFASHLPAIGDALSDFSDSLMPFVENIKQIDGDALMGAVYTAGILAVLAGGNIIQGIAEKFSGKSLGDVGDGLKNFGTGITEFAKATSEIKGAEFKDTAEAALTIAKMLGQLATGDLVSAITGLFTGWKDYNTTINQLGAFGKGISEFATNTEGITKSSVEGAVAAGECLAALLHALPNQGGLLGAIVGNNNLEFFTKEKLGGFGAAIREFAFQVNGLDPTMADGAVEIASKLFSIQLPNQGLSVTSFFVGDNKMEYFTKDVLGGFGAAIREFAFQATGLDAGMCDGAIDIASKLFALEIPNQGGFIGAIVGNNDFETVAPGLEAMGRGIKSFGQSVSSLDSNAIVGVQVAVQVIDALASTIPNSGMSFLETMNDIIVAMHNDGKKWNDTASTDSLKNAFAAIGDAFTNISTSFSSITVEEINRIVNSIEAIARLSIALQDFDSTNIINFSKSMQVCGDFGVSKFLEEFQNGATDVTPAIIAFFNAISGAMHQEISIITDACASTVTYISNEFYNHDDLFNNAGNHLIAQVMVGMSKALPSLQSYTDRAGKSIGDTLVKAINSKGAEAEAAGEHLIASGSVMEGMQKAYPHLYEYIATKLPAGMSTAIATVGDFLGPKFESVGKMLGIDMSQGLGAGLSNVISTLNAFMGKSETMESLMKKGFTASEAAQRLASTKKTKGMVEELTSQIFGGTDAMNEMKEAADNLTEGLDGVGGAAGGAGSSVKDFANTIYDALNSTSGMSFFNKLELKAETSAQAILDNMKSNVDGMVSWSTKLAQLMERGLNKEMIQTMAEAGLDSYDQISAFMNMTDEQIMEANNLFLQAEQVRATAAADLGAGWRNIGGGTMEGFAEGVKRNLELATGSVNEAMTETIEEGKEVLDENSPSRVFREMGDNSMLGFYLGLWSTATLKVYPECAKIAENVIKTFTLSMGDGKSGSPAYEIGKNFTIGIAEGMKSAIKELEEAASEVAEIPEKASKKTTKEASPSKVAIEIGKFFDLGLAKGIRDNARDVEMASNDLASTPVDAIRSSMSSMESYMTSNIDLNPIIRPSLDISGVSSEASNLAKLFNEQHEYRLNAMQNDWSNPDVRTSFLDTFANRIGSEYADRVVDAISNKDMNANVTLEGDAAGVFKLVRNENRAFIRRTGYSGI